MKQFRYMILGSLVALLAACSQECIDDLSGQYDNILRIESRQATVLETQKMGKGIKQLSVNLGEAQLNMGSREWILQPGTYVVGDVSLHGGGAATVTGKSATSGSIDVNVLGDQYYLKAFVALSDGQEAIVNYVGPLDFVVGVDDPEPTGYTYQMDTQVGISVFDWSTFTNTDYPDVSKYTISIFSPAGAKVAEMGIVNRHDCTMTHLAGTYTVASSAHDVLTVDAGYSMPEYGMAGGTFFTDDSGMARYVESGVIVVETVTTSDGTELVSFTGSGITAIDAAGTETTDNAFKITGIVKQ